MSEDLLPTDQYYIRNGQTFAGRNRIEDKSLHPKKVYCPTDGDVELASSLFKCCHLTLTFLISVSGVLSGFPMAAINSLPVELPLEKYITIFMHF